MPSTPDIIQERAELRPALSSTGDVPVFLSQDSPPETAPSESEVSLSSELEVESQDSSDAPDSPSGGETETTEQSDTQPEPTVAKPDPRTVRQREADARIARLEGLLGDAIAALKERSAPPTETPSPPQPPVAPPEAPRPSRADYVDPDSYDAAMVAWAAGEGARKALVEKAVADKIAEEKAAAERQTATMAEQQRAVEATWQERRAKYVEEHPDYVEVVERDDLPITLVMGQLIKRAEDGAAIAHWLGQNQAEATRIAAIQEPGLVIYELGRISARLAAPKPVQVSRTPPPIKSLGTNAAATEKTLEEIGSEGSMDEYARKREPQIRSERRPNTMIGQRLN